MSFFCENSNEGEWSMECLLKLFVALFLVGAVLVLKYSSGSMIGWEDFLENGGMLAIGIIAAFGFAYAISCFLLKDISKKNKS